MVTIGEIGSAGVWGAEAFLGPGPRTCHLCGLSPLDTIKGNSKADPSMSLLEMDTPDPRDPLLRSRYRCRNQHACEQRRKEL